MGWPGAGADATATIGGAGGMALHVQRRQDPAEEATLTMPEMLSSFGSEFWMKNQLFRVTFVGFASLHIFICNKYFKSLYQLLHCKYTALKVVSPLKSLTLFSTVRLFGSSGPAVLDLAILRLFRLL